MKRKVFMEDSEELTALKNSYRLLSEKYPNHDLLTFVKLNSREFHFTPRYADVFSDENDKSPIQAYIRYTSALESALRDETKLIKR